MTDDEFIRQMTVGTLPEDREPGKAEEAFRALVEGSQGFLGLEPGRRGSEAYRTGQALSNLPALALPAAAIKGTGKAKDALKALGKVKTNVPPGAIVGPDGEPVVIYRGVVFAEDPTEGMMTGASRPGYATFGSTSPHVASSYANPELEIGERGAITPLFVIADQVVEFPVTVDRYGSRRFDKFEFDRRAKNLKEGQVLVARNVVDYGPRAKVELDPKKLYSYGSDIYAFGPETKTKPAIGKVLETEPQSNEVSTTDFIRKRAKGSPEQGEVDIAEQMTVGTPPKDKPTFNTGSLLAQYGISPADAAAFLGRAGTGISLAMQPSEARGMTMDEYLAMKQASLDLGEAAPADGSAAKALLQAIRSRNPAQGAQAAQEMMRVYSGYGDEIKGRFDVSKTDPRSDMGRALYASTSPGIASESAAGRLVARNLLPNAPAVYPLDIPKQSILFLEQKYPSELALKLKKFANKTPIPEGPTITGEDLYQVIRKLPKEKQGEAVRLLGFKGAQFLPGGKPLSTGNFAIFNTDGTVSAITGKQFKDGGEVTRFIKAHA